MLVSAKEMVANAYAGHYAIGAFNLNNLEWTKSVLKAAQETNSPVIVQVSEGAGKYPFLRLLRRQTLRLSYRYPRVQASTWPASRQLRTS